MMIKICLQELYRLRRFECEDFALWCQLGKENVVVTDVGAGVKNDPVRLNVLDEPSFRLQLAFRVVPGKIRIVGDKFNRRTVRNQCVNWFQLTVVTEERLRAPAHGSYASSWMDLGLKHPLLGLSQAHWETITSLCWTLVAEVESTTLGECSASACEGLGSNQMSAKSID